MPAVLRSETTRLLGSQKFNEGDHRGPCAVSFGLEEESPVATVNNYQRDYCWVFTVVLAGWCGVYCVDFSSRPSQEAVG